MIQSTVDCLPFGNAHEQMIRAQLQRKNTVAEIVPVNYDLTSTYSAHQGDDGECGYTGRVLNQDEFWRMWNLNEQDQDDCQDLVYYLDRRKKYEWQPSHDRR